MFSSCVEGGGDDGAGGGGEGDAVMHATHFFGWGVAGRLESTLWPLNYELCTGCVPFDGARPRSILLPANWWSLAGKNGRKPITNDQSTACVHYLQKPPRRPRVCETK